MTAAAEIVAGTRAEQGLPVTVEDPAALAKIAALLQSGGANG